MIPNRNIRVANCLMIIGFSIPLIVSTSAFSSDTLPAYKYSDSQLLDAGWSPTQIAELRASAPNTAPIDDKRSTPETASQPTPPVLLQYHSVFEQYTPFEYLPDTDWRKANANVARIGGWRSYTRQVREQQKKEALERANTTLKNGDKQ